MKLGQEIDEAGKIEHIAQAFAVGLEHDREVVVLLGHLKQRLRLEPLLPEGRSLPGTGAGDHQGARRVLPKARPEQGRAGELGDNAILDLVGVDEHETGVWRLLGVGKVDDDPVVGPDGVRFQAQLVADAGAQGKTPGGVDPPAEGREDAQTPVSDLVTEALDDKRAIGGHDAGCRLLLTQELDQVVGGPAIEVVVAPQDLRVLLDSPAGERADRLAELAGTTHAVSLPKGDGAGETRSRE